MSKKNLICAVPTIYKEFPAMATYSTYHVGKCNTCPTEVWIGERSQKLIDEEGAKVACPECFRDVYGLDASYFEKNAKSLTDLDGQA